MSKTETEAKPSAKTSKPKLSDAQKVEKAQADLKEAITKQIENEEKYDNSKFLGGIAKSAIKSFEAGKKADWATIGNEVAIFTRIADPSVDEIKKALTDLSRLALVINEKAEKEAKKESEPSSKNDDSEESSSESEEEEQ